MKQDNIDIDQIKKAWVEMGKSLGMCPSIDNDPDVLARKKTSLERLRDRYCVFYIASFIMVFMSIFLFTRVLPSGSSLNIWLGVSFAVYFLTASLMDFWLWRGVGSIDPLSMGVAAVAEKSMFYRKRHLQFMAVLIPMAIALIGFMGYVFSSDTSFLYSMVVGAIVGLIIGIFQFRKFMAEYRDLSK